MLKIGPTRDRSRVWKHPRRPRRTYHVGSYKRLGIHSIPVVFCSLVFDPELTLGQVTSCEWIAEVVAQEAGKTCDRIFTPLVTLALFLGQVLSDDHSCRAVVLRLLAWRRHADCRSVRQIRAVTARPGGGCLTRSCRDWFGSPLTATRGSSPQNGCSMVVAWSSRTARRRARPILQPTSRLSPNTATRNAAVAFQSHEWSCCCRWLQAASSMRR